MKIHFISMEEDKNSEIDWKNTFDEQIQGVSPQNIERKVHNPSFQENLKKSQPHKRKSIRKTIVIILVVLILAYSLLVFISSQQPGIFFTRNYHLFMFMANWKKFKKETV